MQDKLDAMLQRDGQSNLLHLSLSLCVVERVTVHLQGTMQFTASSCTEDRVAVLAQQSTRQITSA